MSTLDILIAWSRHLEWKAKLKPFLEGCGKWALTESQAISPNECELGKWLYSQGLEKYESLAAIGTLETTHEELHLVVKRVVQLRRAGDVLGAAQEFAKIAPISANIVALLEQMRKQVAG